MYKGRQGEKGKKVGLVQVIKFLSRNAASSTVNYTLKDSLSLTIQVSLGRQQFGLNSECENDLELSCTNGRQKVGFLG